MALMRVRKHATHWIGLCAVLCYGAVFATWDEAATCLFLGAVLPIHLMAMSQLLRFCPPSFLPTAVAMSRVSLLVPVVAGVIG